MPRAQRQKEDVCFPGSVQRLWHGRLFNLEKLCRRHWRCTEWLMRYLEQQLHDAAARRNFAKAVVESSGNGEQLALWKRRTVQN